MNKPNIKQLLNTFESLDYTIFSEAPLKWNLNCFGIRASSRRSNRFDDWMGYFYRYGRDWYMHLMSATVDSGEYYLLHPLRKEGAAGLVEGQYKGAYALGKHRGLYTALVQVKPVKVYRDKNRDSVLDYMPNTIMRGLFGINQHRANSRYAPKYVGKWSAGCQVVQSPTDFDIYMAACRGAEQNFGNSFTYTLLREDQIVNDRVIV